MASGLPAFATGYGGPLEIIEDGISGFPIDPNHGGDAARKLLAFFESCLSRGECREKISNGGIARAASRYTAYGKPTAPLTRRTP